MSMVVFMMTVHYIIGEHSGILGSKCIDFCSALLLFCTKQMTGRIVWSAFFRCLTFVLLINSCITQVGFDEGAEGANKSGITLGMFHGLCVT